MDADAALNEYVRRMIVNGSIDHIDGWPIAAVRLQDVRQHFQACPSLIVRSAQGENGAYGCDTGCDYARISAEASCAHYPGPYDAEIGWFGEVSDIYEILDEIRREAGDAV